LNGAPVRRPMTERPAVVIADPIDAAAVARLRAGPCRVIDASADPSTLAGALADAWGLVVRSRTKVTRELIATAPRLRLIARAGVGLDNVDVAAAAARGIRVVNAPTAATTSVAELTVALYLSLVRGLYPAIASTKAGRWEKGSHGHELAGKTVGFVGYGRIAREVARRVRAFDVRTIAFDPFVASTDDGTALRPLAAVLAEADLVSVHAAVTPENHHLIDATAIATMKKGSYLVNVARGALVDETALLAALNAGHLAGAALDVFETEPPADRALVEHPKLLPTPHLGAATEEGQRRAGADTVDAVLKALHELAPVASVPGGGGR
jgi:D-3-phosphoglycerate dehydrogenase / 2-oxoglutarate reductase